MDVGEEERLRRAVKVEVLFLKHHGVCIGSDREPPDLKTSLQFLTQPVAGAVFLVGILSWIVVGSWLGLVCQAHWSQTNGVEDPGLMLDWTGSRFLLTGTQLQELSWKTYPVGKKLLRD